MNTLLQDPLLNPTLVPEQLSGVHYIPILTTIISLTFGAILFRRYLIRGGTHHLWWSGGVLAYGLGTGLEGCITLLGNSVGLTKAWYIAGALLGGYPLAQGSVYFHFSRNTANRLTGLTLPLLVLLSLLVVFSPVQAASMESFPAFRGPSAVAVDPLVHSHYQPVRSGFPGRDGRLECLALCPAGRRCQSRHRECPDRYGSHAARDRGRDGQSGSCGSALCGRVFRHHSNLDRLRLLRENPQPCKNCLKVHELTC